MANIIFSEGSGLNDSIFGKSQAPIRIFIEKRGEQYEAESTLPRLFSMIESENYAEKFTSMTAMDGFKPVGENGAHPLDGMQEGYSKTLEAVTWKDSFTISREILDDNRVLDLKQRPAGFIGGYYRTREKFGAALYAGALSGSKLVKFEGHGFDTSSADGEAAFSKNHKGKVSGKSQSNLFSDTFSVDALGALETTMQNFRGDNDELLDIVPDTIVIPNLFALKQAVFAAIGADKDPATANNGFNYQFGRWNVVVNPYLNQYIAAGIAPWILLDSRYNEEHGGAILVDRTPLEVRSSVDENNDANVWRGYARFTGGFNDWRFAAVGGMVGGTALLG